MRLASSLLLSVCVSFSSVSALGVVDPQFAGRCAARTKKAAEAAIRDSKTATSLVGRGKVRGERVQESIERTHKRVEEVLEANRKAQAALTATVAAHRGVDADQLDYDSDERFELGRQVVIAEHAAEEVQRVLRLFRNSDKPKHLSRQARLRIIQD